MLIFENQQILIGGVEKVKQGTLAFVISDQLLYIRGVQGWRTITVIEVRCNISKTRECFITFQNTEKRVEITMRSVVFLTKLEVLG